MRGIQKVEGYSKSQRRASAQCRAHPSAHRSHGMIENMRSSIKLEVHNISQRHQRRTEPQPQATCTKMWWSSALRSSSYASKQRDSRPPTVTKI